MKVYFKKKEQIYEDVTITDSTLAQQYLAVKRQMSDRRTKRDGLMKQINQIDSELNILERNLIAIESKAADQQAKQQTTQQPQVQKTQAQEVKPQETQTQTVQPQEVKQ
jgi:hypothetical protein